MNGPYVDQTSGLEGLRAENARLTENHGQVIVDECHHVDAVSFDAILKRTKATMYWA